MRIATVANVEEAIQLAESLKQQGEYNWFRGQERAEWLPSSSLERRLKAGSNIEELDEEVSRFLDWARNVPELAYLENPSNEHALYAILQHYGYPTSYIDFTTEPSVAGFFASDTTQQLEEGTISSIFCLNTKDLVDFYVDHKNFIGEKMKVEPVTVDVSNLWRLQAQHGHFLNTNHPWYAIYDMDRIEFPWTGPTAYPQRDQIYPPQKSHLEQLLDEFQSLEQRRRGQKNMRLLMDELREKGVKIEHIPYSNPLRYEESVFSAEPALLNCWKKEVLSDWFVEKQEQFYQVNGKLKDISIRSVSGAPAPHIQIKVAFSSALSREPNLRSYAVNWKISGLEGQLDVERYLNAIQSAWNGMRNLPYENNDIATAMQVITQLFLIGNCDSILGRIMNDAFSKWLPDAYEIEFGNDLLDTVSRAYCSSDLLVECLDSEWKKSCKDQEMVASAYGSLYACSKPHYMFDFEKFARLFASQIIPAQLAIGRPLVLFNPAKLDFFGNP